MIRKPAALLLAMILGIPAFADTRKSQIDESHSGLHVMNNTEFAVFLQKLDANVVAWKARLESDDISSLALDTQERKEIGRSYRLCLKTLDNTREEIRTLSAKQTLKFDFLLLVDLDELARDLDRLNSDLANTITAQKRTAQKSLGYARDVLAIDAALAPQVAAFQQHILAFAGMMDATLEATDRGEEPSSAQ
jgi:hypothetical protein